MINHLSWETPIQESIFLLYFLTIGSNTRILWKGGNSSHFILSKRLYQGWTGFYGEFFEKRFCSLIGINMDFSNFENITLIHSFTHFHNRNPCFSCSIEENWLDRRGTTILWQDRSMYIYTELERHIQNLCREYTPIGNDYKIITLIRTYGIKKIYISSNTLRWENRYLMIHCQNLYWSWLEFFGTADRYILIRYNKRYLHIRRLNEVCKYRCRQDRGTKKSNTHMQRV